MEYLDASQIKKKKNVPVCTHCGRQLRLNPPCCSAGATQMATKGQREMDALRGSFREICGSKCES